MQKSSSSARENDPNKTSLPKIDQQKTKKSYKVKPTFQMKISKPWTKQAKRVPLYIHEEPIKEPPSLFKKEKSEPKVFQFDAGFFKGPRSKKPKQEKIVATEEEEEKEYRMHSRFKLYPRKPLSELKEVDYDKNEKQKRRRHRHNQNGEEIEHEYYENEEEELDDLNRSRKLMLKEEEEEEKRRMRRKQKKEEEAKRKAEEEAKRLAEEEEARRKAEEEEERRKIEEEEARRKAEEEARIRAEEEAKRKAEEEEAKRKAEEEARIKAEEEAKRKAEEGEEARKRAEEEEAKRKAEEEEEAKRRAEEEVKRLAEEEEEAKRRAEEEDKRKAEEEEEARRRAEEEEAKRLAEEEEARRKAEEEAKRLAEEEEARRKAEEEAKRLAEEEEARKKAEEEARIKAEEEARKKAEEEARIKAEEEARIKAEEEAKRKAEEEAKRKAEEEAKRKAEEEAKRKAEEEAKRKAEEEAKRKAEEEAKRKAEEEAKRKAEEEAKKKAEEEAKRKAEEEARRKAEEEAKRKAEEEAKKKAEEEAKKKAEAETKKTYGDTKKLNPVLDNLIEDNASKISGTNANTKTGETDNNDTSGDKSRNVDLDNDENSKDQVKSAKSSKKKGLSTSNKSNNQDGNDEDDEDDEEEEAKESGRDQQEQAQEKLSEEQLQELPPPLPKSSYILGIDFGTSTTRFAIYKDNSLDTRISEFTLPSAVAFDRYSGQPYFNFINTKKKNKNNNKKNDEKDKKNVGKTTFNGKTVKGGFSATGHLHLCLNDDEDPDDIMSNDDYIVVPAIKRLLGREISQETAKSLPFDLEISGSGKKKRERIKITDTDTLSFEQVAALILAEGKRIVEDQLKEDVSDAVLCVPGFFSNNQKTSMKDAATIAGFNVIKLVSETIAVVTAMKTNNGKHMDQIVEQEKSQGENNTQNNGVLGGLLSNTLSAVTGDSSNNNNNNNNNINGNNNNNNNNNNSKTTPTSNNSNSKSEDGALQGVFTNTLSGVLGNSNNNNTNNNNNNNTSANNNNSTNNNTNNMNSGTNTDLTKGSKNGDDSKGNGDDDGEDSQKKAIVIEFGAGNLDASIVGFGKDTVTIDKSSGDTSLGGMDIDRAILDLILTKIPTEKATSIRESHAAMRTLMQACENFRINHSSKQSSNQNADTKNDDSEAGSVVVDGILDDFDLNVQITESEYTTIMSPFCKRLTACLEDLFKHNKTKPKDIKELIFVGGVTKTPIFRNVITKYITNNIKNDTENNDKTATTDTTTNDDSSLPFKVVYINSQGVMLGAAIQGAIIKGDTSIKSIKIRNALFLSIGFSLADGTTSILIPRGKALPCSKSTKTTTFKDNQRNVTFDIVEGERKMAEDNIKLGNVCVKGIEKAPRGVPQIEIKMTIDEEGILLVEAKDIKTGSKIKTKMTSKTNLRKDEVKKMLASAEINKQRDNYRRKQAETKSKLKFYLLEMESKGKELNDQKFLDLIDKYYDWIDENDDAKPSEYVEMYKKSKKELGSYIKNISPQNA